MRFDLEAYGPSLISRERGAQLREDVLARAGDTDTVELDFHATDRASYSFVDELVGKLVTMHHRGELAANVTVINAPNVVAFHVDQCLARRLPPVAV